MLYTIKKRTVPVSMIFIVVFFLFSFTLKTSQALTVEDLLTEQNTTAIKDSSDAIKDSSEMIIKILQGDLEGDRKDDEETRDKYTNLKTTTLKNFVQSIVNFIDTGFDGVAAFVTDTSKFFKDIVYTVVGDFILNDPALDSVCESFKNTTRVSLSSRYKTFTDKIKCAFSYTTADGSTSSSTDTSSFTSGGDSSDSASYWSNYLQVSTIPQNNPIGAEVLARQEMEERVEAAKKEAEQEATWGNGFMPWKDCTNSTTGETASSYAALDAKANAGGNRSGTNATMSGPSNTTCVTKTPGSIIANKMGWADSSSLRQLELVEDFNSITYADANTSLLTNLGAIGTGGLTGQNTSTTNASDTSDQTTWEDILNYLEELDSSTTTTGDNGGNDGGNDGVYGGDISGDNTDTDNDGTPDSTDTDDDGTPDSTDTDDDGDSTPDIIDTDNGNDIRTMDLTTAKNTLLSAIALVKTPEQDYHDAYNSVYTTASSSESLFRGIVSCYESALASTTITLTSIEITTATLMISSASTTANSMLTTKNSVSTYVTNSQYSLNSLDALSASVQAATTIDDLVVIQTSLTNLLPSVHNSDQATAAEDVSTALLNQISTESVNRTSMQASCLLFPVR